MRYGRRFSLPIDPWPRASLGERLSVTFVLGFLLLVPFCAAGAVLLVVAALAIHVGKSYVLGTALRAVIDGRTRRPAIPPIASRTAAIRRA